jgi:uncharacterized protein (DUF885 family)
MGAVRDLADAYLGELARLDPALATELGWAEHQGELADLSPAGAAARAELADTTLARLADLPAGDDADRRCRALMQDRLALAVAEFDAGEHLRPLSVIAGAPAAIQGAFDLMAHQTDQQWNDVAERIGAVPEALAGLRASLQAGIASGVMAAPRQALGCAAQLSTWSGRGGDQAFLATLVNQAPDRLRARVGAHLDRANAALAELADWLSDTYAGAAADVPDAVGRDRYLVAARQFLGADLDPDEA